MRQLALGLSQTGFAVLVPTFPEAARLEIEPVMKEQVLESFRFLLSQPQIRSTNAGIFGLSFGGTMALLAASDDSLRDQIAWVVTLGAFPSLESVMRKLAARSDDPYLKELYDKNFATPDQRETLPREIAIPKDISWNPKLRVLLLHGNEDELISREEWTRLGALLRERGVAARSYLVHLTGHARLKGLALQWRNLRAAAAVIRLRAVPRKSDLTPFKC